MILKTNYKKIISTTFVFAIVLIMTTNIKTAGAILSLPFGGAITFTEVCNEGIRITVSRPIPKMYILTFTSIRNTPSMAWPRIGQLTLGLYNPVPITCTKGTVPTGTGLPIFMAGGSTL